MTKEREKAREAEKAGADQKLDDALENSFPASDPPAMTCSSRAAPAKGRDREKKDREAVR